MPKGVKSIETRHYEEREALFDGLGRLSRRAFFRVAGISAGIAAAKGLVTPRSFQLVEVANAQPASGAAPKFTFAYISDTHLYRDTLNDRFVRAILKAVDDVNNLDPQPDFVLDSPNDHGMEGLVCLFGIESPGLTSSLAIGAEVVKRLS